MFAHLDSHITLVVMVRSHCRMSWVLGMLSRQELGAHSRRWHTVAARQAGGRRAGLGSRIDLTRQEMTGLEEEGKVGRSDREYCLLSSL